MALKMNELIKVIRLSNNLSQKELAIEIGCTVQYISNLEHGHYKKPSIGFFKRLANCKCLGLDIEMYDLEDYKLLNEIKEFRN